MCVCVENAFCLINSYLKTRNVENVGFKYNYIVSQNKPNSLQFRRSSQEKNLVLKKLQKLIPVENLK